MMEQARKDMRMGVALDQAATDALDPKRINLGRAEQPEVSAQDKVYGAWVQCPYTGTVMWAEGLHTDYYIPVRCWVDGMVFLA